MRSARGRGRGCRAWCRLGLDTGRFGGGRSGFLRAGPSRGRGTRLGAGLLRRGVGGLRRCRAGFRRPCRLRADLLRRCGGRGWCRLGLDTGRIGSGRSGFLRVGPGRGCGTRLGAGLLRRRRGGLRRAGGGFRRSWRLRAALLRGQGECLWRACGRIRRRRFANLSWLRRSSVPLWREFRRRIHARLSGRQGAISRRLVFGFRRSVAGRCRQLLGLFKGCGELGRNFRCRRARGGCCGSRCRSRADSAVSIRRGRQG